MGSLVAQGIPRSAVSVVVGAEISQDAHRTRFGRDSCPSESRSFAEGRLSLSAVGLNIAEGVDISCELCLNTCSGVREVMWDNHDMRL